MMCDPTPLVDHVYQRSMDKYLDKITYKNLGMNTDLLSGESKVQLPEYDLLKALYGESKFQLSGSGLLKALYSESNSSTPWIRITQQ